MNAFDYKKYSINVYRNCESLNISESVDSIDKRIQFEEWLLDVYSSIESTKQDFELHTRIISMLCSKARKNPTDRREDFLIASLISKIDPWQRKDDAFLFDVFG